MTGKLSDRLQEYFVILCENNSLPPAEMKILGDCKALEEQNEKMLRKFRRIPATVADAYNESVALREDLVLALETCQILQAGISWFNVDEQNDIMEKLYIKYQVGWGEEDAKTSKEEAKALRG